MKSKLLAFGGALVLATNISNAAVYDNNISALNINMLTDVFMSYTDYGEKMSDLFLNHKMYGTMTRFDEYGDDGSTVRGFDSGYASGDYFIDNIWVNANHVNESMHYGHNVTQHGRFNLATIGATTKASELTYGKISFGGFVSYINTKMPEFHGNGDVAGIFAKYKYRNIGAKLMTNIGSLNNTTQNDRDFNNSWVNVATGVSAALNIDNTLLVRPNVYVAYTFVSSDDIYENGDIVSSSDFNFFNVAPEIEFIKEIAANWYGGLSAKYVAHFGGKNDIQIGNNKIEGLYLDNHTDIGMNLEYNFNPFAFRANVHKQLGGVDGWSTNINVKYSF